jgi:dihydroorotase
VIAEYGEDIDATYHSMIRSEEACYLSSSFAVGLAKKHGTRLHILHISTAKELSLFDNTIPLVQKKITAEACVHHLWFSQEDYKTKGNLIKWNPAVKQASDRDAILQAVIDNRIDVLATDHAPHTWEEKSMPYLKAPSGGPLVQHNLNALLQLYKQGKITLEKIVEKACHNVAILFEIDRRGFIREGFYADLVLVDLNQNYTVSKSNILYKCGWSPFEGTQFDSVITHTFVNGNLVYKEGKFDESQYGKRLLFNR